MPPAPGLVILLYHRVGRRSPSRVDIPEWLFEEQMARLAEDPGVTTLDEALSAVGSWDDPARVVVTFDDGTADFVEIALPILVRHSVPTTLYVATGFVEDQRPFARDGVPTTWNALRDAVTTGLVTIGSHTHSHCLLDRTPPAEAAVDLDQSIELIGERLGIRANHFAYPKALLGTPAVREEVRVRFDSAAIAGTQPNPLPSPDRYCLNRSPIQVEDGLRFFERKAAGGMRLEDRLRQVANRRRYVGLRN